MRTEDWVPEWAYIRGYTIIPNILFEFSNELGLKAHHIALVIAIMASRRSLGTFPAIETLAKMVGAGRASVRRWLKELEEMRVVDVARTPGHSNTYSLFPLWRRILELNKPAGDQIEPPVMDQSEPPKGDQIEPPRGDQNETPPAERVDQSEPPRVDQNEPAQNEPPRVDQNELPNTCGVAQIEPGVAQIEPGGWLKLSPEQHNIQATQYKQLNNNIRQAEEKKEAKREIRTKEEFIEALRQLGFENDEILGEEEGDE